MNFSTRVKLEMISKKPKKPCCKRAALSAFIRCAGSVVTRGGRVGFIVVSDSAVADYFADLIEKLYGEKAKRTLEKNGRKKLTVLSETSAKVLIDLKIVEIDEDGLDLRLDISDEFVKNDCCRSAYMTGAFLGSGSVTVPLIDNKKSTGYHLEFVFSKYVTACDFSDLLCKKGFLPKTVERKGNFVVYFKNAQEIGDMIASLGANRAYLDFTDLLVKKEVRNGENRKINCELSNMSKQIDASIRSREEITLIGDCIGLDVLGESLRSVCEARLNNKEASMSELAEILGISKSCLNHRLRKISEIAKNLR